MSAPDYTKSEKDFHQEAFTEARLRKIGPTTNEFQITSQTQPLSTVENIAVGVSPYMNTRMTYPQTLLDNVNTRYQI